MQKCKGLGERSRDNFLSLIETVTMAGAGASELHIVVRKAHNHQVALLVQKSWCLSSKMLLEEAKVKKLTKELEGRADVTGLPSWAPTLAHRVYLNISFF